MVERRKPSCDDAGLVHDRIESRHSRVFPQANTRSTAVLVDEFDTVAVIVIATLLSPRAARLAESDTSPVPFSSMNSMPAFSIALRIFSPVPSRPPSSPSAGFKSGATPGWGVQLVGSPSQASALASFQQLQRVYSGIEQIFSGCTLR